MPSPLTRAQAAELLGVSISTLRRLQQRGALHPRKGPRGAWLYDRAEVEALREERLRSSAAAHPEGELAAEVFALLDAGLHPVELVTRLRVDPERIEALVARWARWREGLLLGPKARRALEAHLGRSVPDGAALLRALEEPPPSQAEADAEIEALPPLRIMLPELSDLSELPSEPEPEPSIEERLEAIFARPLASSSRSPKR